MTVSGFIVVGPTSCSRPRRKVLALRRSHNRRSALSLRFLGGCLILQVVQILNRPDAGIGPGLTLVRGQWLGLVIFVAAVCQAAAQPLARWTFDAEHIEGTKVVDRAGGLHGVIQGPVRLSKDPFGALNLDGSENSVDVPNIQLADFPRNQISVEAWVSLDSGLAWGGIVGCFQDNGDFEKGWLLGYDESHFRFAVSATGRLTYLAAASTFQKGQWYYVVGTYDGQTMKLYVDGKLEGTATDQHGDIVYPPKAFLTIGAYRDDDEFFRMQGKIHDVAVYGRALDPKEIESGFSAKKMQTSLPFAFRVPPHARFVTPDSAVVTWETDVPSECSIEFGAGEKLDQQIRDAGSKTSHQITLRGLQPRARYQYRIRTDSSKETNSVSEAFELDNGVNYSVARVAQSPPAYVDDARSRRCSQVAEQILSATGVMRGYCLVLDCNEGQLAYELAKRSELTIVGVDTDPNQIARARAALRKAGVYGSRITLHQVDSLDALPFPGSFANLIVADDPPAGGELPGTAAKLIPLLQPATGVACLGPWRSATQPDVKTRMAQWLGEVKASWELVKSDAGGWVRLKRELPPGTGSWTHQYGEPGNTANSGEGLQGIARTDRLEVQWLGRPGGDFGIDRNPRMPAPLAVNGRLFHQGLNRFVALDSYNGAVLWSMEIPALRRVNMPRDAGNWCADPEDLYIAVKDRCWVIAAATGVLLRTFQVAEPAWRGSHDWGYVARVGDLLYGSSVKQGAVYTDFWGTESWYDKTSGPGTEKICSDDLFALTPERGELKWRHRGGVVINSTIAIAGGKVLFVECRNPDVAALTTGRIGSAKLWENQFLVALDARTGSKLWEQPLDTADGIVVFYLLAAADKVFIASSAAGKYTLYAYSAGDGKSLWQATHDWPNDNHGGHMQHPVIVADRIYLEPCGYETGTGKLVTKDMGRHAGCATYAATLNALIYRGEGARVAMWDIENGGVTSWYNLRPSCWLSTVPANGMVLSPEGGGGCSCGNWLETSIGFAPGRNTAAK